MADKRKIEGEFGASESIESTPDEAVIRAQALEQINQKEALQAAGVAHLDLSKIPEGQVSDEIKANLKAGLKTDQAGKLSPETLAMLETLNIDPAILINRNPEEIRKATQSIVSREGDADYQALMGFSNEVSGIEGDQTANPE